MNLPARVQARADFPKPSMHEPPAFTGHTASGGATYAPAGHRSGLKWAAGVFAVLLGLLFGLLTLWMIGYDTGPVPLVVGLIIAVLPVPIYVTFVLWLDRYETEPAWMLAAAFFWGAMVAVFFAIVVNSIGSAIVHEMFDAEVADFYGMVISAPLVEETAKAVALLILFLWKKDEFDGVLDGIVYASMVGLGFAMTENIKYYGEAVLEGDAVGVFVVRGLFSPYAHPLFTSMTGIGLGLARESSGRVAKFFLPVVGFALAVTLHAVWNGSLYVGVHMESAALVFLMYFVVMVPIFASVLVAVGFALRREGHILRRHLWNELQAGTLSHEEYERLCSIAGRMGSSFRALTSGGPGSWRARRQFHGAASELAFHRHRVSRGITARDGSDASREAAYLARMCELRARMGAGGTRA